MSISGRDVASVFEHGAAARIDAMTDEGKPKIANLSKAKLLEIGLVGTRQDLKPLVDEVLRLRKLVDRLDEWRRLGQ